MSSLFLGIGLMIVGIVLIVVGRPGGTKSTVSASGGSVAVGRDSIGPITNVSIAASSPKPSGHHIVTTIGIIVELVGIAVTIWHAIHLSAR
jgi:hypothetical protein